MPEGAGEMEEMTCLRSQRSLKYRGTLCDLESRARLERSPTLNRPWEPMVLLVVDAVLVTANTRQEACSTISPSRPSRPSPCVVPTTSRDPHKCSPSRRTPRIADPTRSKLAKTPAAMLTTAVAKSGKTATALT